MKIERTKNASRNMLFGIVLKLYQIIFPFFLRTVMVNSLGVEYLGLNSLFTSVLQVLNLAELGVGSAMVFSMYKPIVEDDDLTICALMKLYKLYYRVIGCIILVCGLAILPFISYLIKGYIPESVNIYYVYLLNLLATVFSYWLFAYRNSILQAYQRVDVISKVTIITDTFKYGLQLGALFYFKNYYFFICAILISQLITNIITAILSKKMYPQYESKGYLPKEQVNMINNRIKDLFTSRLGGTIVNSSDTIVISAFLGLTTLAIYQNYYYIMSSVVLFITVILSSCTAGIGNSLLTESKEKNYNDFNKFYLMNFWIVGICVCCFLNVYQPFMIVWMGEDNLLSFGCVVLLCMYFYLFTTNQYLCLYKDAAGMWHEDRFRPLVSGIVNLSLNLILVNYIGIFAIILSTILSYAIVTLPWLIHNLFSVVFKMSPIGFLKKMAYNTVLVIIAAMSSFAVCIPFNRPTFIAVTLRLLLSVLLPSILFYLTLKKSTEFSEAVDTFNRITHNKMRKFTNKL